MGWLEAPFTRPLTLWLSGITVLFSTAMPWIIAGGIAVVVALAAVVWAWRCETGGTKVPYLEPHGAASLPTIECNIRFDRLANR